MRVVGIDCGNAYTKAVLLVDGKLKGKTCVPTAFDLNLAAQTALDHLYEQTDVSLADMVVATGAGRDAIEFADEQFSVVQSAAMGAYVFDPDIEMVIDLGAEGYRAITLREEGKVRHYEGNDRCAAGSGTFVETMARTLELTTDEIDDVAQEHDCDLTIASQCVVFAESEVVSLIHAKEKVPNIAYGVISGVGNRVATVAKREGVCEKTVLVGGLGGNKTMLECLTRELGVEVRSVDNPQYIGAIGAAVLAARQ
ncbi:acyl-CoA dehydratase activase [Adlercreutzia sp. ZJ138]|uniref:acyl-CoA dehydratase activase n=1 Tax=Adlercreutzia sp. ZJ138 TaxID=2709405 RepID=UPI0013ED8D6C|nr:acyl-CoA dehydratase activase [Adlercreutzia sp. ZJ138]